MEPLKLRIKNFYALADGEVDFTKFSSALILGYYENNTLMSNGAGKSSIFEAICWVIFNETRQTKVDDVIRWSVNETLVEFEFLFGRKTYKISRRRSRVAKESSVSLFTKEDDKWVNDSGSTNSETNKKILSLLKIDAKIFLNSVYFKQHDISLFANANPSERKEIIKSIMKLERWDEYQKQAKNKLRVTKDEIEKQLRVINENNNISVTQILNEKSIDETNSLISELTKQQRDVQTKLHSLFELKKEKNLNNLFKRLDETNQNIFELKKNGKKLQEHLITTTEMLDGSLEKNRLYAKQVIDVENQIAKTIEQIQCLKKENCAYQELEDIILTSRVEKARLENLLQELSETSAMVGVGECQVCLTQITENSLPHIHESRKKRKTKTEQDLGLILAELGLLEKDYKTRKTNKDNLDINLSKVEAQNMELTRINLQKQITDDECISLKNECATVEASIRSIIDQIKSLKIVLEAVEHSIAEQKIHNIDVEINDIEEQNRVLTKEVSLKNIELGTLLKEKEFITQKTAQVNGATEMLNKLAKEKVSCDQLVRFFGKEGIQAVFIESVVDELEQYANETLAYICNEPTVIHLRTQKKTGDSWQETLEIDVIMNGYPQTFESLGGGERFRISLALRIGLSEVLVKRAGGEIKLLLLDEVDSPLDTYGLNNLFENIVKGLEKRFKILVISHNDKLKDRFNDLITVNKTSNGSFILQE